MTIVEGPVNTERFIKFLQEQVVRFTDNFLLVSLIDKLENRCRLLTLILAPRSVLVMDDNCRIDHGEDVRRLVEDDHCEFLQ